MGEEVETLSHDRLAELRSRRIGFVLRPSICCSGSMRWAMWAAAGSSRVGPPRAAGEGGDGARHGRGARRQVTAQIRWLGANLLIIWGGSANLGGVRLGAGGRSNLSWDEAQAIAREVPPAEVATGTIRQGFQMAAGNRNWQAVVIATDPDHFVAHEWVAEEGRLFGPQEATAARKVVVLGATVAETLFGEENPVGCEIRIRQTPFEVIGVMARKGRNPMGQDRDDAVVIPYWTARRRVMGASRANARQVSVISVKVHEGEDMREAEEATRALMRQRHRVAAGVLVSLSLSRALADLAGWPVLVQTDAVLLAVGVSALTGLFFGFWAARLDPIAASRHD